MGKGIDRARPFTVAEAQTLARFGYGYIGRYLSDSNWKRLSSIEVDAITNAGLYIVSIFQNSQNNVSFFTPAYAKSNALSALHQAHQLKQPSKTPIYFAVDFDPTPDELIRIVTYFKLLVEMFKPFGYYVGIYGGGRTVEYICEHVPQIEYKFQTLAWSRGRVVNGVHLFQKRIDCLLPEYPSFGTVDLVDSNGAAGGWKPTK